MEFLPSSNVDWTFSHAKESTSWSGMLQTNHMKQYFQSSSLLVVSATGGSFVSSFFDSSSSFGSKEKMITNSGSSVALFLSTYLSE